MQSLSENIIAYAKEIGFDICKIIKAESLDDKHSQAFSDYLENDFAGEMEYMKKEPEKRMDLLKKFPDAKTIIIVGINYFQGDFGRNGTVESRHCLDSTNATGKIARYAWGRDYHKIFEKKLKLLKEFILKNLDSCLRRNDSFRLYVDYGPILERAYAEKAGLGFIGRNTCLITEEFGSWVFLGELVTNLELSAENRELRKDNTEKAINSKNSVLSSQFSPLSCGNCHQCISVCPTGALEGPYRLNAKKCISYLTIENKGSIPEEFRSQIGDWLYGCDLCQEVCPHNVRAKATKEPEFKKRILGDTQLLKDILSIRTDDEFRSKFAGSPVIRIKRKGLLRNACVVAGNSKDKSLIPYLEGCLKDEEELVREHAEWALNKIALSKMRPIAK